MEALQVVAVPLGALGVARESQHPDGDGDLVEDADLSRLDREVHPRGGDGPSGPRMSDGDGMGGLGRSPGGFIGVRGTAPRQKFGVSKGDFMIF